MKNSFSLLFYLKKRATQENCALPIYIRITVDGQRAEAATGRKCDPSRWNVIAGRGIGMKENMRTLNAYLDGLQAKAYQAQQMLIQHGEDVTAARIRDYLTDKVDKTRTVLGIFEEHNRKMAALVGREYAAGTLERYETSLRHTRCFIQWKYKVSDIDIRKVDHSFITEYEFYLRSVRKCGNNSAVKYIKNFGKIIRICIASGWLDKDPFRNYTSRLKKVERPFLSKEELDKIASKEFGAERLVQVRDIFLFCCYTGLAYADVQKLNRNSIRPGVDGLDWIFVKRTKTGTPTSVPLLPEALNILKRYQIHPQCLNTDRLLPVSSNQKMNAYLKEITDVCGISKKITFHVARHTFATTVTLLNGVSIESVSKMLGHTNIKTTQHYARILDIKISEDMKRLRENTIA